jgi:hypothetical protein
MQRVHTRLVTSVFSTGFLALIPALATNAPAAAQCGEPDGGDCCVPHTAVGCNDSACCTAVCNADPFCCEVGWDEYCAGEAVATCGCTPPDRQVVGFGATVTLPSGLVVEKHDLAIRDHQTGAWSIWLDGEDVGLSGTTIAGAAPLAANGTLAGLAGGPAGGAYEAYDILRFTPTSLGATTAGTWSFHFDGSDVGLAGNTNRIIQSVSALADGSLVISVKGSTSVPGVSSVTAFDLLRFTPTSLGAATAGTWSKHFEGTDVGLSQNPEKLDNGWVRGDGSIVLSTLGNVNVTGFSGTKGDLFAFFPTSLGSVTAGSFAPFARLSELGLPSGVNLRAAFRMPVTYPTGPRPGGGGGGGAGDLRLLHAESHPVLRGRLVLRSGLRDRSDLLRGRVGRVLRRRRHAGLPAVHAGPAGGDGLRRDRHASGRSRGERLRPRGVRHRGGRVDDVLRRRRRRTLREGRGRGGPAAERRAGAGDRRGRQPGRPRERSRRPRLRRLGSRPLHPDLAR